MNRDDMLVWLSLSRVVVLCGCGALRPYDGFDGYAPLV